MMREVGHEDQVVLLGAQIRRRHVACHMHDAAAQPLGETALAVDDENHSSSVAGAAGTP